MKRISMIGLVSICIWACNNASNDTGTERDTSASSLPTSPTTDTNKNSDNSANTNSGTHVMSGDTSHRQPLNSDTLKPR